MEGAGEGNPMIPLQTKCRRDQFSKIRAKAKEQTRFKTKDTWHEEWETIPHLNTLLAKHCSTSRSAVRKTCSMPQELSNWICTRNTCQLRKGYCAQRHLKLLNLTPISTVITLSQLSKNRSIIHSMSDLRSYTILELHRNTILPIPPLNMKVDEYHAIDYVSQYYFGRVLQIHGQFIKFKFLHCVQHGANAANLFDWPWRDDIANVYLSCVFYEPVQIEGNTHLQFRNMSRLRKHSNISRSIDEKQCFLVIFYMAEKTIPVILNVEATVVSSSQPFFTEQLNCLLNE